MKKLKFLIILIVLFMSSCEFFLGKEQPAQYYYMSDEFKSYVMFPVGSWWVYQDSITGQTDTLTLLFQAVDMVEYADNVHVEQLFQDFGYGRYPMNTVCGKEIMYMGDPRIYICIENIGDTVCGDMIYKAHLDTLILNNCKFTDMKHYNVGGIDEFWCPYIGVVKYKATTSDTLCK